MANPPDEELILYFYGEHPESEALARALADDPEMARRFAALTRDLAPLAAVEAPEPRTGLEARLWARLAPELAGGPPRRAWWLAPRAWLPLAATATLLVLVGFWLGRGNRVSAPPSEIATRQALGALSPEARDRVLAAALADHLGASERLLVEVSNETPSLDEERRWAQALLSSNRLYRLAAERAGQHRVAAVLAELEPLLSELAQAPANGAAALGAARRRIDSQDLVFKVRITRSNI